MEKVFKPKIESPQKLQEPEIETWEDEGGNVEVEQETTIEILEKTWREIVADAREEFSDNFKIALDKILLGKRVSPEEQSDFALGLDNWWKENFGIKFSQRTLSIQQTKKGGQWAEERSAKLTELEIKKKEEMVKLHEALISLDAGEPVNEFRDETRRVVYFDEENKQYFIVGSNLRKNIGIGDIISDYAWGIKYVPDGEMTEPAYRTIAKRILVNETRRDLEGIHNSELITKKPHRMGAALFTKMWPKIKESFEKEDAGDHGQQPAEKLLEQSIGFVIEVQVREFISRIGLNMNLDFIVSRSTVEEDVDYKYDFKMRGKHRIRGVDVQSKNINSIGFQLKSRLRRGGVGVNIHSKRNGAVVDEILTLKVPGQEFRDVVKKWFKAGEPSGGPEQFLSPKLKGAILKAVTKKLTEIPQEVFDKLE